MRAKRTVQMSIFDLYAPHEIGRELKAMSQLLEANGALTDMVAADLRCHEVGHTGREGIPAESVLRCAVLKQYRQLSYEELAFYLSDSMSFRAFAKLPVDQFPKKSALHNTISTIRPQTWEAINRHLLTAAAADGIETGRMLRLDSTVTLSPIHQPTDNSLLWDAMRLMVRLLRRAQTVPGVPKLKWRNRSRQAKKHNRAIEYSRGQTQRLHHYKVLINACRASLRDLRTAETMLAGLPAADRWLAQYRTDMPLICRIIEQAERRVLEGQQVPAAQKLVSLFEPHTDIIRKGGRDVYYGHKLTLTTGRSGLILDLIIEDGNPSDAERFIPILDRHIELYKKPPRQMAADGAYASNDNLQQAKSKGVRDVAFHKKRGFAVKDMVKSHWVYRKLRNFRAGIEADISCLKRAYGLGRCTWKGLDRFKAYVWSSVLAYNLALMARLKSA